MVDVVKFETFIFKNQLFVVFVNTFYTKSTRWQIFDGLSCLEGRPSD